jgi:hypothetical protein
MLSCHANPAFIVARLPFKFTSCLATKFPAPPFSSSTQTRDSTSTYTSRERIAPSAAYDVEAPQSLAHTTPFDARAAARAAAGQAPGVRQLPEPAAREPADAWDHRRRPGEPARGGGCGAAARRCETECGLACGRAWTRRSGGPPCARCWILAARLNSVCVQPETTTLFGVPFPLLASLVRWAQRLRDMPKVRDSRAATLRTWRQHGQAY